MTERTTVAKLVPAYCSPNKDPASAGRLRSAFVAHTMFFHEAGANAVQLDKLVAAGVDDRDTLVSLLCESYSRAVFESLFSLHFDRMDPQSDVQLLEAISGVYGAEVAAAVHAEVELRGIVLSRVQPTPVFLDVAAANIESAHARCTVCGAAFAEDPKQPGTWRCPWCSHASG